MATLLVILVLTVLTTSALAVPRRLRAAVWGGRLPRGLGALPRLEVPAHEAPRGYKAMQLLLSPAGDAAVFAGVSVGGSYTADDGAVCVLHAAHDAPDLGCECGFYAYADRERARWLLGRRVGFGGDVVVRSLCEVELLGRVVEHDLGYRAQRQRVLGVRLLPWCADCAAVGRLVTASCLGTDGRPALPELPWAREGSAARAGVHPSVQRLWEFSPLRPVCEACGDRLSLVGVCLRVPEVTAMLGTEVGWLDADVIDPQRVLAAHDRR